MKKNDSQVWVAPELTIESWTETEDLLGFILGPIHS